MKTVLSTLLLIIATLVAHAQTPTPAYAALPKDSATQKVAYSAVVQVPGASARELFGRASEWFARQRGVMIGGATSDPATGRQVAHITFQQPPLTFTDTHSNLYDFAVAVYTKDGRYMYRIDEFNYQNINPALLTKDANQTVPLEYYATQKESKRSAATLADFNKRMLALIDGLRLAMSASGKAAPKGW